MSLTSPSPHFFTLFKKPYRLEREAASAGAHRPPLDLLDFGYVTKRFACILIARERSPIFFHRVIGH